MNKKHHISSPFKIWGKGEESDYSVITLKHILCSNYVQWQQLFSQVFGNPNAQI